MAEGDDNSENPLIKALPPETDYLTYLTIIEYNLTKAQLPLLHELLQDTRLTTNIGWDLVHLLLPLLPESEECLGDIACLGNPRETVLKVGELLEGLQTDAEGIPSDDEDETSSSHDQETERIGILVSKFESLLHMLCVLHPRIQTKYPSRFLVTTLQAILPAYRVLAHVPAATRAVLMFLKSLSGSKRPGLPPRASQQAIPTVRASQIAPDPEAQPEGQSPEEEGLKARLLRSFTTHVTEIYINSLDGVDEGSALMLTGRYFETRYPGRVVPHRQTTRAMFKDIQELSDRDTCVSQILTTGEGDLLMPWSDILSLVMTPTAELDPNESIISAPEFPASRLGALYMLALKVANTLLADNKKPFELSLFPDHETLMKAYIGDEALNGIGAEPSALVDAVLILGWAALSSHNGFTEPEPDDRFNRYLQRLSLLAAKTASGSLRYQAHFLASTILHAHKNPQTRLSFISDTLEHCPYENLRSCAIGWFKDEVLAAFGQTNAQQTASISEFRTDGGSGTSNIFSDPKTLLRVAPDIFSHPKVADEIELISNMPLWHTAVNLYYLLYSSDVLCKGLDVGKMSLEVDVDGTFIRPLEAIVKGFEEPRADRFKGFSDECMFEIRVLGDSLDRARKAAAAIQSSERAPLAIRANGAERE